ncbi:hypothetical protein NIES23_03890 [Trichormus variabilis NIES-23]|uniref:Uncharacterized protein n=2 Tax=Nostocales TaxID=1161 RepID=A0A1Z4KF39_ANAVA|nr:hypothetical protein NIES23_03890 [Trichormus variabilis NIES-23]
MVGVTSIEVKESLDNLVERLRQAETAKVKERLQVLYWLKQENPFFCSFLMLIPNAINSS